MDRGVLVPNGQALHVQEQLALRQGEVSTPGPSRLTGCQLCGATGVELPCDGLPRQPVLVLVLQPGGVEILPSLICGVHMAACNSTSSVTYSQGAPTGQASLRPAMVFQMLYHFLFDLKKSQEHLHRFIQTIVG